MKNKELAKNIKALRNRKGFSQEELSEKTGLSLRTIQRVENGETEPRGDSLKRLANAFNVSSDEIIDWNVQEDKGLLISLNLSALSFIFFPILGILVPLIIWISKKDKIRDVNEIAKELLNFQITWTMLLFVGYISPIVYFIYSLKTTGNTNAGSISSQIMITLLVFVVMYLYNLVIVIINSIRINNNKSVVYFPKIRFIRK
ncbi:MAG: helix-turn-helix domain-containing protein [Labilibaculum sp.]|nr:helix-turn-helix domain-containing protein [Labilibaculum sp.]MBI9056677.1 helix-turn-helix domain-containing protein [Labilibaculum sp.]